jgi:hemolysin III
LIGVGVFATTMVRLYLTSTLYHVLPNSRARELLQKLDHGAIYPFIAGSYTPFALQAASSVTGWMLLSMTWSSAPEGRVSQSV